MAGAIIIILLDYSHILQAETERVSSCSCSMHISLSNAEISNDVHNLLKMLEHTSVGIQQSNDDRAMLQFLEDIDPE